MNINQINLDHAMLDPFDGKYERDERCGVLLGKRTDDGFNVRAIVEVPNRDEDPRMRFTIRKSDVARALARTNWKIEDVIGCIHTHPYGSTVDPSWVDVDALDLGDLGIVYHQTTRSIVYYTFAEGFIGKEDRA